MQISEKKKYTDEDYMMLEEGAPFQLINYDLIMSPSPTSSHQNILLEFILTLVNHLKSTNNQGYAAFAPLDVKFDDGNVFQPDIIFISAERKTELVKERIEGAPDMVVEVLSPSSAYYDLRHKKDIYEKFGVKEYIIIDTIAKTAEVYSLKNGAYQLRQKASETERLNSVLLPGLSFEVNKLFQ